MAEPTLYLFDGYNLLNAGGFEDVRELRDALASFVALRGARGVLVFDGHGPDERVGGLEVRFVEDADALLERLAAEHRDGERVVLVSSDFAVRGTSGQEVRSVGSQTFVRELGGSGAVPEAAPPGQLADKLDTRTRERLERLRRGQG